jgi:hypothetical protein
MYRTLRVTDANLLIRLISEHGFYSAFASFYEKHYMPNEFKNILNTFGFICEESKIKIIELIFDKFKIDHNIYTSDILFLLKTIEEDFIFAKYSKASRYGSQMLQYISEIKNLNNVIKKELNQEHFPLEKISFKFSRRSHIKNHSFENQNLLAEIILSIQRFLEDEKQQHLLKSIEEEAGESHLRAIYARYGKLSDNKDSSKIIIQRRASFILRAYILKKPLSELKSNFQVVSNNAAEFIGWLLASINLMEYSKVEYDNYKIIQNSYPTYENYLSQKIKSYLSTGKNPSK